MEDSGIDSGDTKTFCDISNTLSPIRSTVGVPTSRIMQKRLGARNRNQESKKSSVSLLPLQRLPIPGARESQPLVAWDTDESEEEIVSFFPPPKKSPSWPQNNTKNTTSGSNSPADPLDSISVEELSITDEDEDGDDLELVLPSGNESSNSVLCCGARFCCLL